MRWIPLAVACVALTGGCTLDYGSFRVDGSGAGTGVGGGGVGASGGGDVDGTGAGANGGAGATGAGSGTGASSTGGSATGGSAAGGAGGAGGLGGTGGVKMPVCGDSFIDPGEECDDGPGSPSPYCTAGCVVVCDGQYDVKDPLTHHCYYDTVVDGVHSTWQEGQAWCAASWGGHLVVISNAAELAFVAALAPNQYNEDRWIGAHDRDTEGSYEWVNGEPWVFTDGVPPWQSGEPSGASSDDCIVLRSTGELAEVSCVQNWTHHMCERPPVGKP